MKLEWLYHTGFIVRDMDKTLAFYRDLLGMTVERDAVLEDEFYDRVLGYPKTKIRLAFVGNGDMRHSLELIQFLNPPGEQVAPLERNSVGAVHLGVIVDGIDAYYEKLSAAGIVFVNPPAFRDATHPWARKACYFQDPDGNWVEFVERAPAP